MADQFMTGAVYCMLGNVRIGYAKAKLPAEQGFLVIDKRN
jgi:hypothetical protein